MMRGGGVPPSRQSDTARPFNVEKTYSQEIPTVPQMDTRTRISKHELFIQMAWLVAHRSHCGKLAVGCVITDERGQRIAVGYNGLAAGGPNFCGVEDPAERCDCVHAEANAAIKANWTGPKIAYVTQAPCGTCAALLTNAGVVEVIVGD